MARGKLVKEKKSAPTKVKANSSSFSNSGTDNAALL
jgi:hypothetical protein